MTSIVNGQKEGGQSGSKAFGRQRYLALPGDQLGTIGEWEGRGKSRLVGGFRTDFSNRYGAQFGQFQNDLRLARRQYSTVEMSPDKCEGNTREHPAKQSKCGVH